MTSPISRRNLARGMVWSAPVVIASVRVPAFAASVNPEYLWYDSQSHEFVPKGGSIKDLYVYTTDPVDENPAGFSISYKPGMGEDTTATLQRLDYYVMVPTRFSNDGIPATYGSTSTYWTPLTKVTAATLAVDNGAGGTTSISTTGYNVYKTSFKGVMTNPVVGIDGRTTWPGTTVDLGFFGFTKATTGSYYAGYVTSFTTANGFTMTDSNGIEKYTF
ncbi:hypothetical protein ACIP5Z_07195 [Rothia terrae]|uniref:hypothetical protein n=1 Tax=Rothia terrae TaxID=396015 RepID=UPI0028814E10|nr:hypothetical protein [Rothia terrae]MDT0189561.1 hypothetical protein [Rothia terrae]